MDITRLKQIVDEAEMSDEGRSFVDTLLPLSDDVKGQDLILRVMDLEIEMLDWEDAKVAEVKQWLSGMAEKAKGGMVLDELIKEFESGAPKNEDLDDEDDEPVVQLADDDGQIKESAVSIPEEPKVDVEAIKKQEEERLAQVREQLKGIQGGKTMEPAVHLADGDGTGQVNTFNNSQGQMPINVPQTGVFRGQMPQPAEHF